MGSVKDLKIISEATNENTGTGRFIFSPKISAYFFVCPAFDSYTTAFIKSPTSN